MSRKTSYEPFPQGKGSSLEFAYWNLDFIWILEFGIWIFGRRDVQILD